MDALPANRSRQPSCGHGTYQHEAITSRSRQLLMMSTWLPETCWATNRKEIKNTKVTSSWFFLSTLNRKWENVLFRRAATTLTNHVKTLMRHLRGVLSVSVQIYFVGFTQRSVVRQRFPLHKNEARVLFASRLDNTHLYAKCNPLFYMFYSRVKNFVHIHK